MAKRIQSTTDDEFINEHAGQAFALILHGLIERGHSAEEAANLIEAWLGQFLRRLAA